MIVSSSIVVTIVANVSILLGVVGVCRILFIRLAREFIRQGLVLRIKRSHLILQRGDVYRQAVVLLTLILDCLVGYLLSLLCFGKVFTEKVIISIRIG